jgi:hypothetical protein
MAPAQIVVTDKSQYSIEQKSFKVREKGHLSKAQKVPTLDFPPELSTNGPFRRLDATK